MADPPLLPWPDAVAWHHVPRAPGTATATTPVRPVFAWLGGITVTHDYGYPPHRHQGFELIAVRQGRYRCHLDGAELTLARGEALVVSPGQLHQDHLAPPLRYVGVAFHLDGCPALFRPMAPIADRVARDPGLLGVLAALEDEAASDDRVAARIQDALLAALFWRIVRALPAHALAPELVLRLDDEAFPVRLSRVLEDRLHQPTRLADLARSLGMSPRGLTAACRRHGLPAPMAQLAEARLLRARDLLAGREVKQVAAALAFASPFHFSRAFRRRFGLPPSAAAGMPGA